MPRIFSIGSYHFEGAHDNYHEAFLWFPSGQHKSRFHEEHIPLQGVVGNSVQMGHVALLAGDRP